MPTSRCDSPRSCSAPAERPAVGPVTFRRLEIASFCHSLVYLGLLVCAFALGGPQPETFWLGLAHGVLWIAMSLVCIAAAKARVIPFWLAVTVAVLGGLGPFAGTLGFVYLERNRSREAEYSRLSQPDVRRDQHHPS
jgi:hypothetical protein